MKAAEFTSTILGEIERAFYPGAKMRFLQDRTELLEAILLPNRYLNERTAIATGAQYAAIVRKVIQTIGAHGTPDPRRRFSLYFLKCMQTHLQHQGEDYLRDAKTLSALAGNTARTLRQLEAIETTNALDQARRALTLKGGRKRAIQKSSKASELDLFALCKTVAGAIPKEAKTSSNLCKTGSDSKNLLISRNRPPCDSK